jgi:hypothetical protein
MCVIDLYKSARCFSDGIFFSYKTQVIIQVFFWNADAK